MKISREWLQTFFDAPLPEAKALADALTFHAFEIESVDPSTSVRQAQDKSLGAGNDSVLDVKVTPNRGHDCLSHRGIAKELSAILRIPMKNDGLRKSITLEPITTEVKVDVEDATLCPRFTGVLIHGIKVGASPDWLVKRLMAVGQKSINNIVDATNYVMFDIGQPLHAFDMSKIKDQTLAVKRTKKEEQFVALDDKIYALPKGTLVIADNERTLSIAGIKGGKTSGVSDTTTDIFLEAANWDGVNIRKTSQGLKLRTDASDRFQQVISPELAAYGTHVAAKLIVELAGGEIVGYVDEYPSPQKLQSVSVSTGKVNKVLGTELSDADVTSAFMRLGLRCTQKGSEFIVDVPFERLDLVIPEDLIEEVARIVGYDKIPTTELPVFSKKPEVNPNFYAAEKVREELMSKGYSEVYTSVFAEKGERAVANKIGGERPYLRDSLSETLTNAIKRNLFNAPLLGLNIIKLFEVGTVWRNGKEEILVGTAEGKFDGGLMRVGTKETPLREYETTETSSDFPVSETEQYKSFSRYPFIVRDIALWCPQGVEPVEVLDVIRKSAGELLVHSEKFDEFKKDEKQSYAFRLVFQSFDRTLTDDDANSRMESVYEAVKKRGWEVR